MTKARILLVALLDMAVDIVLPTVIYLVLQPLDVPSVLSLTAGGILVGGKAAFGKLSDTGERDTVLLLASTIAALAALFGLYAASGSTVIAMVSGVAVQGIGVATSISAEFRRLERIGTAALGLVLLAEAVLRVVLAFQFGADDVAASSLVSQLPVIGLFVLFLVGLKLFLVPRLTRFVEAELAAAATGTAP
jgi:hypothetical protein